MPGILFIPDDIVELIANQISSQQVRCQFLSSCDLHIEYALQHDPSNTSMCIVVQSIRKASW